MSSLSSDEEREPSDEEVSSGGDESSRDESSEDGGGQAARARKRKAKATGRTYEGSSYRGVTFHDGRWEARIKVNGQLKHLGGFDSEEAAARAFDERAKETRDAPALNFLPDGSLNPDRKTPSGLPLVPDPGRPSTYRGVRFHKGRWVAQIRVNGQQKYLGGFDSEEVAARAYDERAKQTRGSPVLNFLPDGSLNPDRKKRGRMPAGQRAASAVAAEEDEHTFAIKEEAEQETRSGSSRRRGRGVGIVKEEEEEDERTVAINEEADGEEERLGKRGRRRQRAAVKEEEADALTVAIKGEDDEITLGVC